MNKYAKAAIRAVDLYKNGHAESPELAWEKLLLRYLEKEQVRKRKIAQKELF